MEDARASSTWRLGVAVFLAVFAYLVCACPGLDEFYLNPDHGYQLSLGRQLLLGKHPFVDFFFVYGPAVAYTSAFGFLFGDGPLGEVLICSAGYALAIAAATCAVRKYASPTSALLVAAAMLWTLPRIYKWYYWCLPALVLLVFARSLEVRAGRRRDAGLLGLVVGVAALYRADLGLACGALAVFAWIASVTSFDAERLRKLPFLLVAACVPYAAWLAFLVFHGGGAAVLDFLRFTRDGTLSMIRSHEDYLPTPSVDLEEPLGKASVVAIALWVVPIFHVLALAVCARRLTRSPADPRRALLLGAAALGGLCLFPQALHAVERQHFLQTLPFLPATVALLLTELGGAPGLGWRPSARELVGWSVALLALVPLRGGFDLRPADPPLRKWRALARGPATDARQPLLQVIAETEALVPIGERVLVLPRPGKHHPSQLYAWIRRPLAGIFNIYFPGLFEEEEWRLRNYREVLAHPPVAVVADKSVLRPGRATAKLGHAELLDWVRANYTEVAFAADEWRVLRRPSK